MENITNITKIPNGLTISGKNYVFTGDATIINDTSAHIVTDQGIIYVDTSSTVENRNFADINELLTNVNFRGTKHNPPELTLLSSEFTQAQADAIAINSAKVGIASAGVTSGNLTISLTDGTTPINSVNVVGPTGPTGPVGPAGTSGINGISGGHVLTKPVANREYSARLNGTPGFTYTTPGRNGISLYPFIPANSLTIKNLKINVASVVAGALVRILVYSDLNGVTYSNLLESTSLDASTQGDKTYTASFTFTAGTTYWLGVHSSSTASLIVLDAVAMMSIGGSLYQNNTNVTTTITFPNAPDILGTTTPSTGYAFSIILTAA